MGIFDGDTVSSAFIGSSAIIEPPDYIDSVKTAVLSAIRNDGESIANNIILGSKMGFSSAIEKFQEYAEHEYYYPPPLVFEYDENDYSVEIKAAITQEVGEPVSLKGDIYWAAKALFLEEFYNDPFLSISYPDDIVIKLSAQGESYKGLQMRFAEELQKNATWISPASWDAYRLPSGTPGDIQFDYGFPTSNNVYENEMYAIQSKIVTGSNFIQVGFRWANPNDSSDPLARLWTIPAPSSPFLVSSDDFVWAVEYYLNSNPTQPYYWTYQPSEWHIPFHRSKIYT